MSDDTQRPGSISAPAVSEAAKPLLTDLRELIQAARERAATAVNAELTMLYWRIG